MFILVLKNFVLIDKTDLVEIISQGARWVRYPLTSRPLSTQPPQTDSLQQRGPFLPRLLCLPLHMDLHNLFKHEAAASGQDSDRNASVRRAGGKETLANMCKAAEARRRSSRGLALGAEGRSPSALPVLHRHLAALMEVDLEHHC